MITPYLIYNEDCLDVMEAMVESNVKVDCIITDPPYLYINHKLDKAFNEERFFELASKLTDKIAFFGRGDSFYKWNLLCSEFGFEFKEELVWDKGNITSPTQVVGRKHELISVRIKKGTMNKVRIPYVKSIIQEDNVEKALRDLKRVLQSLKVTSKEYESIIKYLTTGERLMRQHKGKHDITHQMKLETGNVGVNLLKSFCDGVGLSSIVRTKLDRNNKQHPTQKPTFLMECLVKLLSDENHTVFDPFMGSGTTGVSCFNTNRKFIGCEIDKDYFDIASKRLKES